MKIVFDKIVSSPQETQKLGAEFARTLTPGTVITFNGNLGAGKTTCIKGLCAGLGVTQHVTSPTFTLINEYAGDLPVYHFDFYRIQSEYEVVDLGLAEYFEGDGVCLIEWPDVIEHLLPKNRFEFRLEWDPSTPMETRHITLHSL